VQRKAKHFYFIFISWRRSRRRRRYAGNFDKTLKEIEMEEKTFFPLLPFSRLDSGGDGGGGIISLFQGEKDHHPARVDPTDFHTFSDECMNIYFRNGSCGSSWMDPSKVEKDRMH
jgi:hypothetical protein